MSARRSGGAGLTWLPLDRRRSVAGHGLLSVTAVLVGFGLLSVYSAGSFVAHVRGYGDGYYLFQQLSKAGLGLLVLLAASLVDYRVYRRLAWPLLLLSVVLLLILLLPGTEAIAPRINGARRWLRVGPTFQPSEVAKIAVVVWTAALAAKKQERVTDFRYGLLPFLVVIGTICGLVLLEPHLSAAVMIALLAGAVLFAAGARIRHFAFLMIGALPLLAVQILTAGYRLKRVTAFLDPVGAGAVGGYQLRQSLIAVGSGGMLGVGFGNSRLKMAYLPEPQNDFIFSIISEEWGFLGSLLVIALFLTWSVLGFRIARAAPDDFGRLLAVGLTCLVAVAAFAHIAVALGVLPTTGVNLPFISAGGTNLVLTLGATGILLNIARRGRA